MRLLYLGSGEFGLPTLEHLCQHHEVAAVISQPDRPAGRKRQLKPTPVAEWAEKQGLDVLKTDNVNDPDFIERASKYQPDASVVIAFGQKLSPELIGVLGRLAVNLHASLLPAYRGAAPINWAIIEGERTTGVSVIGLARKMDAGAVYARAEMPIAPDQTAGEAHDQLATLGPDAVQKVLTDLEQGTLQPQPQDDSQASQAPKLKKSDGTVDFNQPAERVRNRIHGLTPWPRCRVSWYCQETGETRTLTLARARALPDLPDFLRRQYAGQPLPPAGTVVEGDLVLAAPGAVQLLEVQAPGTRVMQLGAFARGHYFGPGDRLEPLA
ncbi:MAG: methionyl-tRNA formyltransferase [Phycisphaeraceae bacterium]